MLTLCCFINETTYYNKKEKKDKPFYSVKFIFQEHWENYLKTHKVREIEKQEVEKMLSCKSEKRGGFMFYCKSCDRYEFMPFGCNSRLCSCCGKRYTLAKYIGRYVRYPAIANTRIIAYNGEAVKFYWKDHDDKIHYKIMLVYDFISAIIQHIPEKNQKLVRYYGAYSRRKKKSVKRTLQK